MKCAENVHWLLHAYLLCNVGPMCIEPSKCKFFIERLFQTRNEYKIKAPVYYKLYAKSKYTQM